jgi:hypothetical protein
VQLAREIENFRLCILSARQHGVATGEIAALRHRGNSIKPKELACALAQHFFSAMSWNRRAVALCNIHTESLHRGISQ